jgi:hypothetical protein
MSKTAWLITGLVSQDEPSVRWVAGADAVQTIGNKGRDLIAQADAIENSRPHSHMTTTDPFWVTPSTRAGKTTPWRELAAVLAEFGGVAPWRAKYQTSP